MLCGGGGGGVVVWWWDGEAKGESDDDDEAKARSLEAQKPWTAAPAACVGPKELEDGCVAVFMVCNVVLCGGVRMRARVFFFDRCRRCFPTSCLGPLSLLGPTPMHFILNQTNSHSRYTTLVSSSSD